MGRAVPEGETGRPVAPWRDRERVVGRPPPPHHCMLETLTPTTRALLRHCLASAPAFICLLVATTGARLPTPHSPRLAHFRGWLGGPSRVVSSACSLARFGTSHPFSKRDTKQVNALCL